MSTTGIVLKILACLIEGFEQEPLEPDQNYYHEPEPHQYRILRLCNSL
jgi:hypothetical protein